VINLVNQISREVIYIYDHNPDLKATVDNSVTAYSIRHFHNQVIDGFRLEQGRKFILEESAKRSNI